ncbi:phosphoesterase [Lichenicoccus roseus]|uniref:Phosphoesterase n=2 Tax=Lichenicoccus roseus TaxID=2683649 RepID=A0A5R9J2V3_9PROT|nr:phosphoesterase [Lichenicoccus roseus]
MSPRVRLTCTSMITAVSLVMQPLAACAAGVQAQFASQTSNDASMVVIGPASSGAVMARAHSPAGEPVLSHAQKLALLRKNVKYVFVLFQENRSFDFHLGTFPGANGLFSQPAAQTPGFTQPIVNTDGSVGTISPFLIPATVKDVNGKTVPIYPQDTASVDHSHTGINNSLDFLNGVAKNDRYALDEEGLTTKGGQIVSMSTGVAATSNPTLAAKQTAELAVSHIDCNTVPFLWQFADRFTLFDAMHQTIIGPSSPNAISMIAGQSGVTQWALHPSTGSNNTNPVVAATGGEPVIGDNGPYAGSNYDTSAVKPPYGPNDESPATPDLNQTYASLPLSFLGKQIEKTIQTDQNPALDLIDVQDDIRTIASQQVAPTNWGWYQEGYDTEPTDTNGVDSHATYITHHNAPQYFGYVGDNPAVASNLHGLGDFYTAVSKQTLPSAGGVFYVRGGYGNNDNLKPVDPNPAVQSAFPGSDDHPGYSDTQIAETLLADEVNAIAASPYWKNSAIIITYDETDGLYDHTQPLVRQLDPEGNPLSGGPRIPLMIISPFSRVHAISHEYAEHSSVIKFINELFRLTPLANLPDEVKGVALGKQEFGQSDLGPADGASSPVGNLFSAFDNSRLTGQIAPLPAEYAEIPVSIAHTLPHYGGNGCTALNIIPTDYATGKLIDPAPSDFNPRPSVTPGIPTSGTWTP